MDNETKSELVNIFILYWTNVVLVNGDDTLLGGFTGNDDHRIIRVEEVKLPKTDNVLLEALDLAKPREGEVVLNTVFA